jgi:hypothetical protein
MSKSEPFPMSSQLLPAYGGVQIWLPTPAQLEERAARLAADARANSDLSDDEVMALALSEVAAHRRGE